MNKMGLALAGGGIKSYSELPVVNAFFDLGIPIDAVSGTSMGSVLAALVAIGLDKQELNDVAFTLENKIKDQKVFTKISPKVMPFKKDKLYGGYVDGVVLQEVFEEATAKYGIKKITDVKIPLAIPAVDIITGKIVVFVSHPEQFKKLEEDWIVVSDVDLSFAVRASCSFPFIVSGCEYKDHMLVDGGLRMNTPGALMSAYGMDRIVAVTLHNSVKDFDTLNGLLPYGIRVLDLMRKDVDTSQLQNCDLVINIPVDEIYVFDVGKGKMSYDQGSLIMAQYKHRIKELYEDKSLLRKVKKKIYEYLRTS